MHWIFKLFGLAGLEALIYARSSSQSLDGVFPTQLFLFCLQFWLYMLYRTFIYPSFFSALRHVPQAPNGAFFLDQTRRISREPSGVPLREWMDNVHNQGFIRYSIWFKQRLLITTPAVLREIFVTKNSDFIKPPYLRDGPGRVLGIGLIFAEGEEHKAQRKNLMPAFSFRHVKDSYPMIWKKSKEMIECLSNAALVEESATRTGRPSSTINVGNWCYRATLDIIGLYGMNRDFGSLQDSSSRLSKTYQDIFSQGPRDRILQIAGVFLPFWLRRRLPIQRNKEIDNSVAYIRQVCRNMISGKRAALKSPGEEYETDLLSVAIESGSFTQEELVDQMMTFLVAGHETTATAVTWAIHTLCRHPTIQTKLRNEIRLRIPSPASGTQIMASDIDDCHFLQACVMEVLRLRTPVAVVQRVAARDVIVADQMIPKGTLIIFSPLAFNTSTFLWGTDALEFKPERWLDNGKANMSGSAESNFAFSSFLHGPRSCIGRSFAQAEFAIVLACWVGRFELRFEEGSPFTEGEPDIKNGITSKLREELWCRLTEVPGW